MKIYTVVLKIARFDNEPRSYDANEMGAVLEGKLDGEVGLVSTVISQLQEVEFPDPKGEGDVFDESYKLWEERADKEMAL